MSISGELREIGKQINSLQTKALQLAVAHVDEVGFEYTVSYVKNDGSCHFSYHDTIEEAVKVMEGATDVDWQHCFGATITKQVKARVV